jgi:hypothetical protein
MTVQGSCPISWWGSKLKFGSLIEGPSKAKVQIWNLENFSPWGPKLRMKMQCLQYTDTDGKTRNRVYKEAS